jgi:hypothetical protein
MTDLMVPRPNPCSCQQYKIGGITIQVCADIPISSHTFHPKLLPFLTEISEGDLVQLHHHFELPAIGHEPPGKLIYRTPPWAIYRQEGGWTYLGIATGLDDPTLHRVVYFNADHTIGEIYNPTSAFFREGNLDSITLFPTDQLLLARLLADRQGCILHSAGMIIDGQGLLFAGHSSAGKSTIVTQLRSSGEILCDDRIILRHQSEGFRIFGTWSHGDVPDVSPDSAPLRAILLLEQAPHNRLILVEDHREALHRLLPLVIKPLVTSDWWRKTLDLFAILVCEVPVYRLQFDRSGRVIDVLKELL